MKNLGIIHERLETEYNSFTNRKNKREGEKNEPNRIEKEEV